MHVVEVAHAWVQAHPRAAIGVIAVCIVFALVMLADVYTRRLERRVLQRVTEHHDEIVERHVEAANQEIRDVARDILEDARERRIPLQIVAGTPEEAADLRALLESGHVTVGIDPASTTRRRRTRREQDPQERERFPTAWARILADDEDEREAVASCPTTPETPTTETKKPAPSPRKKKQPARPRTT